MARVMDRIADQYDGPVGSDPPIWDFPRIGASSDKNQPDAANFRRLSVGRAPHDDEDGISDGEKSDSDPGRGLYRSAIGCIDTKASG